MSNERIPIACQSGTSRGRWQALLKIALLFCLSLPFAGCDSESQAPTALELHGAGATFPAPLYERWFSNFVERHPELTIKYEEIGSGSGVRQFIDELVDFAASDEPLSNQEVALVDRGVRQVPMTSGAIVLAYNLRDVNGNPITDLRLSRKALAGIFLGEIRNWLHEEIKRHNPRVAFPDLPIQVEYRLDSSGTTSALTRHLSEISPAWREGPGSGKTVIWPVGAGMPSDSGVSRGLRQVPGAIGYLSYAFAKREGLPMAILENKAGMFVEPTNDSIQLGLRELGSSINESRPFVADPIGENAYPIVTYSWILCYRVYEDPDKIAMLQELLSYGLGEGQEFSEELGYVALMDVVAQNAMGVLASIALPSSADTATAIPVAERKSASDPIAQSVIEAVREVDGDVPERKEFPAEDLSDVKADDVSAKDASKNQEDDDASSEQLKRGES